MNNHKSLYLQNNGQNSNNIQDLRQPHHNSQLHCQLQVPPIYFQPHIMQQKTVFVPPQVSEQRYFNGQYLQGYYLIQHQNPAGGFIFTVQQQKQLTPEEAPVTNGQQVQPAGNNNPVITEDNQRNQLQVNSKKQKLSNPQKTMEQQHKQLTPEAPVTNGQQVQPAITEDNQRNQLQQVNSKKRKRSNPQKTVEQQQQKQLSPEGVPLTSGQQMQPPVTNNLGVTKNNQRTQQVNSKKRKLSNELIQNDQRLQQQVVKTKQRQRSPLLVPARRQEDFFKNYGCDICLMRFDKLSEKTVHMDSVHPNIQGQFIFPLLFCFHLQASNEQQQSSPQEVPLLSAFQQEASDTNNKQLQSGCSSGQQEKQRAPVQEELCLPEQSQQLTPGQTLTDDPQMEATSALNPNNQQQLSWKKEEVVVPLGQPEQKKDTTQNTEQHQQLPPQKSALKIYKCDYCTRRFSKMCYKKQHMNDVHNEENKIKCVTCGKKFDTEEKRDRHALWHTTEKDT
ncbi:transcription factor SPT20 homolog [Aethina tumida]|uniref:transcription factor SPT20 homolog n=1 Tax=Aethina tumida TaxID=116153 RepID=UPI0021488D0F|nr:transcription factor SPT20 homolog [Aethina tumida]